MNQFVKLLYCSMNNVVLENGQFDLFRYNLSDFRRNSCSSFSCYCHVILLWSSLVFVSLREFVNLTPYNSLICDLRSASCCKLFTLYFTIAFLCYSLYLPVFLFNFSSQNTVAFATSPAVYIVTVCFFTLRNYAKIGYPFWWLSLLLVHRLTLDT